MAFGKAAADISKEAAQAVADIEPVNPITWKVIPGAIAWVIVFILMLLIIPYDRYGLLAITVFPVLIGYMVGTYVYDLGFAYKNPDYAATAYGIGLMGRNVGEVFD